MASYRSAAERVFRRLLRLYPGEFRAEWEQEMTVLVRDRSREEPLPSLFLAMLVDTLKTAPREHYAMWSQDLRYALRRMAKNPAFTLVAALSLALGTGAAASIFSMADALVLRPLPIAEPGEVMTLRPKTDTSPWGADFYSFSWPDYLDYREKCRSFTGLVALTDTSLSIATDAKTQAQLRFGMLVSDNFFGVMGVEPVLGRGFLPEEDSVPGRDAVAVVSHSLWKTAFGSDPGAVGKRIRLNGTEFTVVGVAPERFTGMDLFVRPAVFLPMNALPLVSGEEGRKRLQNRGERFLSVKGRLRPGTDAKAAEAELDTIARGLAEAYPATNRENRGVLVRSELQARIDASPPDAYLSGLLLALTGLVLLIACANVANLLLSQAGAREREIALRQAVGASRTRLVRQLLTEGLVLAFLGGVLGLLVASAGVQFFKRIPMSTELVTFGVQLDRRVLLFGFLASSLSVLAFGLVPALRTARADLVTAFKAGDSLQGSKRLWGRKGLVVGQVALALVLLGATATLLRGFGRLLGGEPGYRRDHLLMASFDPTVLRYTDEQAQRFYRDLVERARTLPGARSAALAAAVPTGNGQQGFRYDVEGQARPKDKEAPSTFGISVDEHYFDTFRVPIVKGRAFAVTDTKDAPSVVIVNEHLAEKLWPGRDPLGQRLRLTQDDDAPWAEVVGVARQHRYIWAGEAPSDYVYVPFAQSRRQRMTLLLESVGDPAGLVVPLRGLVASIDPDLPLYNVRTMEDFYAKRVQGIPDIIVQTVGSLGVMGGVLALVGLYGIVAYSVSRRTREIGVRMAVGASRRQVLLMVLGQGLLLASVGIAIGVLGSLGVSRLFTAIIEGIPPVEAVTLLAAPLMLLVACALASLVPALRASRVDPLRALRSE